MSKPPFEKRKYGKPSVSEADLTRDAMQNYMGLRPKFPNNRRRFTSSRRRKK